MKIETTEERLKQDEYGLYINAPNYEDQRARMIHGIEFNKKLERLEKRRNISLFVFIVIIIALFVILIALQ